MLTKVYSAAIEGVDAFPVTIETVVERGVGFTIVGMADTAVKESYQRIVAAMNKSCINFHHRKRSEEHTSELKSQR